MVALNDNNMSTESVGTTSVTTTATPSTGELPVEPNMPDF